VQHGLLLQGREGGCQRREVGRLQHLLHHLLRGLRVCLQTGVCMRTAATEYETARERVG
jgi:hypothetical protein